MSAMVPHSADVHDPDTCYTTDACYMLEAEDVALVLDEAVVVGRRLLPQLEPAIAEMFNDILNNVAECACWAREQKTNR